ncbi:GNAT family N-acetyltransferase [Nocardioides agariphilus]|jgi:RimJ/RimL family protein N-acetyltransferase|nr:GNAT family protein [Nocardioides agariphilus]
MNAPEARTNVAAAPQEAGMLTGEIVGLRVRREEDVPVLHSALYDDVDTRARADSRPWRPIPPDSAESPYAVRGRTEGVATFSVVHLDSLELAGEASLWGIDTHNRSAHVGIALLPRSRGRGLGTDTVRVLCRYGFIGLGLHRLQVETLSDNAAIIRAAARVGFRTEGILRRSSWVSGTFVDQVVLGQLAEEWSASGSARSGD